MTAVQTVKRALRARERDPRAKRFRLGIGLFAALGIICTLLAYKPQITDFFRPGDEVVATFTDSYKLKAHDSSVKLAGLVVGVVTEVNHTDKGMAVVTMKVDRNATGKLGSSPSASIEPRTILGGRYTVDLHPSGSGRYDGRAIPVDRTRLPVEADRVLEALPKPALQGVQGVVGSLDGTLRDGGKDAARKLVQDAPGVLGPAGDVLTAAEGTRPGTDLPQVVTNLSKVADTLTHTDGQLDQIVGSLDTTSRVLSQQSGPLADAVGTLPATLRDTRTGLADLRGTLDRLTTTAPALRPAVPQLGDLVHRLNPVLVQARPLLDDLHPLLTDARPAVQQLVPVAQQGTDILRQVRGPVLDRVNGPVLHTLNNPWHGTGPYKDSGGGSQADHKFYEELAYMATNIDRASMTQDQHGSLLSFQVGAGTDSVVGTPLTLENLMAQISRAAGGAR